MSNQSSRIHCIGQARQHREMAEKFSAYGEMIAWIDTKIAVLDDSWHQLTYDNDALQQLRGQKQVLQDVKGYLNGFLKMDIESEMKKVEDANEDDGA